MIKPTRMPIEENQSPSPLQLKVLHIGEEDISFIAESIFSARRHSERLNRKRLNLESQKVESYSFSDLISYGLNAKAISKRLRPNFNYEQIRAVISSYVSQEQSRIKESLGLEG